MEYSFGTGDHHGLIVEVLKTKGDHHTDFTGQMQTVRIYDDAKIYDSFIVVRKYQSKRDEEGNCYDWYEIRDHYRYIDRYDQNITKVEERIDGEILNTNTGLMETYDLAAGNADDISDCRTALEEIYEMILSEE